LLRFGVFELNLDTEELRKEDIPFKLGPQPFRVLALLAARSGQIVGRDEIRQELWGEQTYVDFEHGLNQCIKQIRNALNDNSSRPLYVETMPRKGYRFLAPVTSKNIAVALTVTASGPEHHVADGPSSGYAASHGQAVAVSQVSVPESAYRDPSAAEGGMAAVAEPAPETTSRSRRSKLIGWLALATLAIVAAVFYWHSQNATALMEKDTIVLADFANSTGDPVFDDTLKQALRIQLEQSPFLNLVPDNKVNSTLKLTGRSAGNRLTPEVTRDICRRTGSKAMLAGSIAQLGSQYVVGVQALNCNTGDVLAEALEQAKTKEDVLKALDRAALTVRRNLGESLHSVQNFATPVEEATTPSLEALQAYSLGRKIGGLQGDTAAIPYYDKAIELDPNFAMAYLSRAYAYRNLNQVGKAAENAAKAYELRSKVTDREKFLIEGFYYRNVTGELEKAAETYELAQQAYPRDPATHRSFVINLAYLGQYERALNEANEAMRLEPDQSGNYSNLGFAHVALNQFDEAEAVYQEAERRKLQGEWISGNRYTLAFVKGDTAKMAELVSAAAGKPGKEDALLQSQAATEGYYGKFQTARDLDVRAVNSASANHAAEAAAQYQATESLREVEAGNLRRARDQADSALKSASNREVKAVTALTLARAGDITQAEKLVSDLDTAFPLDTHVQKYWLPSIRAAIALQKKDPQQAIELLKTSGSLELAWPKVNVLLVPAYLRGQAYLMQGQGAAARAEFQKFIDHRGLVSNFEWGALARLGLARAYALEAQTDAAARDKARTAYQEFLTLWKDADPDLPIYQQAKTEYAKLLAGGS
jgi:DNA-binding winged helix-turn-helix (wHTH) protein/tetratricopeptide (TPR) repeat protein